MRDRERTGPCCTVEAGRPDGAACRVTPCDRRLAPPHREASRVSGACSALLRVVVLQVLPGPCLSKQAGQEGMRQGRERKDLWCEQPGGQWGGCCVQPVRGPDTSPTLEPEDGGQGSRAVASHQISSGPSRMDKTPSQALSQTCCVALSKSLSFSMPLRPTLTFSNSTETSLEEG